MRSQVKHHYYSQHAAGSGLSSAKPSRGSRCASSTGSQRPAISSLPRASLPSWRLATWGLIRFDNPLIWMPLAVVQGFTIFNFTILLHEVVHHTVFERKRPVARADSGAPLRDSERDFGEPVHAAGTWIITRSSAPTRTIRSGITCRRRSTSAGTSCCTARRRSSRSTSAPRAASRRPIRPALQRTIGCERRLSIAAHLTAIALLWYFFGVYAALRTSIIPVFFVFPIAFTLNRLGQHYDIDPDDPAKWGTLMRGHWFWDFAYLNSNYHLEHHYFPGVPFYRLPGASARPRAVLRAKADALADLRRAGLRVDRREPRAPHRLEPVGRPKTPGPQPCRRPSGRPLVRAGRPCIGLAVLVSAGSPCIGLAVLVSGWPEGQRYPGTTAGPIPAK